jgi:hypothetical protein
MGHTDYALGRSLPEYDRLLSRTSVSAADGTDAARGWDYPRGMQVLDVGCGVGDDERRARCARRGNPQLCSPSKPMTTAELMAYPEHPWIRTFWEMVTIPQTLFEHYYGTPSKLTGYPNL